MLLAIIILLVVLAEVGSDSLELTNQQAKSDKARRRRNARQDEEDRRRHIDEHNARVWRKRLDPTASDADKTYWSYR